MTVSDYNKKVGEAVRVEYNSETNEMRLVLEITDQNFKMRVLRNKDLADLIKLVGKDVMVVEE